MLLYSLACHACRSFFEEKSIPYFTHFYESIIKAVGVGTSYQEEASHAIPVPKVVSFDIGK